MLFIFGRGLYLVVDTIVIVCMNVVYFWERIVSCCRYNCNRLYECCLFLGEDCILLSIQSLVCMNVVYFWERIVSCCRYNCNRLYECCLFLGEDCILLSIQSLVCMNVVYFWERIVSCCRYNCNRLYECCLFLGEDCILLSIQSVVCMNTETSHSHCISNQLVFRSHLRLLAGVEKPFITSDDLAKEEITTVHDDWGQIRKRFSENIVDVPRDQHGLE